MASNRRIFKRSSHQFDPQQRKYLSQISEISIDAVLKLLHSSSKGVSENSAEERLEKFGLNEVEYDKAPSWVKQLIQSFVNPFIFILLAIVIISYFIDVYFAAPGEKDFKTVLVVSIMIVVSGLISFIQEFRNNRAAEKVKNMNTKKVKDHRESKN